jgi:hypothetical protein
MAKPTPNPKKAEVLFPSDPEELKTVAEVAEALGRSPAMIRTFIAEGALVPAGSRRNPRGGKPLHLIRAGDIIRVAFRPRWENKSNARKTSGGTILHPTTVPD